MLLKKEIKNNILEDKIFYYRYGFRGTYNFDPEGRSKQHKKNIKKVYDKINSFGPNFLEKIYKKITTLNNNIKLVK